MNEQIKINDLKRDLADSEAAYYQMRKEWADSNRSLEGLIKLYESSFEDWKTQSADSATRIASLERALREVVLTCDMRPCFCGDGHDCSACAAVKRANNLLDKNPVTQREIVIEVGCPACGTEYKTTFKTE